MVRLADIRNDYGNEIGDIIDDLTALTPLNHFDLKETFTDEELADLRQNLADVRNATSENEKVAKLMEQSSKVLKLLKKAGFAI
ncbi:MAG: hypothetical protein KTR23_09760 [Rhodospirillales bacterium]|nr:hypothetical protein [Rhodospirillales bacterium]